VAEKVGFEQMKDYVQHYCMTDEVDYLAEMGFSAFKTGNYQETVECYDKVFALSDEAPDYFYHLAAQACAAVGDHTKAVKYFSTAIDRGWKDIEYTQSREEFRSLQDVQEWQQLLSRLQS
jgi:tetratricopeptide (TPR) repeat protein